MILQMVIREPMQPFMILLRTFVLLMTRNRRFFFKRKWMYQPVIYVFPSGEHLMGAKDPTALLLLSVGFLSGKRVISQLLILNPEKKNARVLTLEPLLPSPT